VIVVIYTHHPRSRFERIMHARHERRRRLRWRRPLVTAGRVPASRRRTLRRASRQQWNYRITHHALPVGPAVVH
jgi:hypothetical protein